MFLLFRFLLSRLHFRLSQVRFLPLQHCPSVLQASPFLPPQFRLYTHLGLFNLAESHPACRTHAEQG